MTTMNRLYNFYGKQFNIVRFLSAHLDERELGLCVIRASIDKHKRGNCVLDTELQC